MPINTIHCLIFILASLLSALSAADSKLPPALELNDKEIQWLSAHPTVTFTGDPNWLPYEAFDSDGQYIGIVSEHLKLISHSTGIEFKMSPSQTWTESTEKAKSGQVDIISETDDSDLKTHLTFTNSYLSNPIVITMRNTEHHVDSLSLIADKKIALIKDYGYAAKIRRKYPNIQFVTVDDIQHGLIAVSTDEVDALLCTLSLCSYTISELGINSLRIVGKTEFDTKLALGVQKNLPELVSILNKAIKQISHQDQQEILDPWIKQKFIPRTDYTLVYEVLFSAAALLILFALWNRRLSREIVLRKTIESELKAAEETLRLSHQRLFLHREQNSLAVIEWNTDFESVYWNDAAEEMFGFKREEVYNQHVSKSILPDSAKEGVYIIWRNLLKNIGSRRSTNENITKDGRIILCEWHSTPLIDEDGKVIGVASVVDDVTQRKTSEETIWKQANFDDLTGLPNRNMFHDRLGQEIIKSKRANLPLALLLLDLDGFKEVNDTLGHDVGDVLLQQTAARIKSCVRESDTVARLGGDEFTIILPELHDKNHIHIVAEHIIQKLAEEFHLGDEAIHITASLGITLFPSDAEQIDGLIKNADQAMYEAKKRGRNCFSYFTQSLQDNALKRLQLSKDLRRAINAQQFEVYFQPIVDIRTNEINKAEALIRWHHPKRGMVSPLDFIPLAEEIGLINEIGDLVFKESARWANHWNKKFNSPLQISVNMSPIQFKLENEVFIKNWLDYLSDTGLSGESIVIEITEGLLMNAEADIMEKLLWLRDAGIQVAIDDFGTGYSSLAYLKKFDIDYLKIDQSFVRNMETDSNDVALSEAIIVMAHKLGLKVIAEGVETEGQRQLLINADCDFAQGYLYAKPVPSKEFEVLLQQQVDLKNRPANR